VRAREPDLEGYVDRLGVKVAYESFGEPDAGRPTVVFVPIDPIVHGRAWKAQVPFLARSAHVVVIDPRGNGRSDRPTDVAAFEWLEFVGDTIAVLDALGVERAVLVGVCVSAWQALMTASLHPDRVQGVVAIGPWARDDLARLEFKADAYEHFDDTLPSYDGWYKLNRNYWKQDWPGFAEFFFGEICNEPHSTKLVEDMVSYACESTADVQLADADVESWPESVPACCNTPSLSTATRCPMVIAST
jgi:pimeloyl-ACP methyl ester carboxylesterase